MTAPGVTGTVVVLVDPFSNIQDLGSHVEDLFSRVSASERRTEVTINSVQEGGYA